jgi:hypothetical protein
MEVKNMETQIGTLTPERTITILTPRLLVLVPPYEFDELALAIRVRTMAEQSDRSICWLALASDPEEDFRMSRCLKGLVVMVASLRIRSDYRLVYRSNWLDAIHEVWREGDQIVCLEGHMVTGLFFFQRSVAKQLAVTTPYPMDVIRGIDLQKPRFTGEFWHEIAFWAISMIVLVAFFYIQISIVENTENLVFGLLIGLSLLVEFWLIAKIGAIF